MRASPRGVTSLAKQNTADNNAYAERWVESGEGGGPGQPSAAIPQDWVGKSTTLAVRAILSGREVRDQPLFCYIQSVRSRESTALGVG